MFYKVLFFFFIKFYINKKCFRSSKNKINKISWDYDLEGFSVPFTVVRCKIRKPTWETGSWVSGVASWPTARLSEMMKSPCSHWNHKQTPRSFQCLLIYTFLLKVIVVRDCQNHGSWCYIFRIHKFLYFDLNTR